MAVARFICPKCKKEYTVNFKVGERPEKKCECGENCVRQFKTLGVGNVVNDTILSTAQTTLYN